MDFSGGGSGGDYPELVVGFAIDTGGSFSEINQLKKVLDSAEGKALQFGNTIERQVNGVRFGGAIAQVTGFGNVMTQQMQRAEKAADRLTAQLNRQIETFGKTAAEIRQIKVDKLASDLERLGNSADAEKIRALNSELVRLEGSNVRAAASAGAHRSAMQGLSFQAQDAFTQISMGTNALSVLAIQGGQAAGQMAGLEGKLGKFANFMIGPWGLAITAGMLVLGALTKGMFDNEDAAKAAADGMKKFQDRQSDIGNFIDATTGRLTEQNRVLVLNAILTRQAQIAENDKASSESRRKAFDAAGVASTRWKADPSVEGGLSMGVDNQVQYVIDRANGDVGRLTRGLAELAKQRPDLAKTALSISSIGGQAVIAQRENERLSKELRALNGDTAALAQGTTGLINKQVALATATTPLAKARAQLALVESQAAAADKAGGAALEKYRVDLTTATKAVQAAEAAQKAAGAARSQARKEETAAARAAVKEANEQKRAQEALVKGATDYAAAQDQIAARVGKTAKEIRAMEDAAARAKAPTEALKLAIDKAAAKREVALGSKADSDFDTNVLKPLRDELALYGLVGAARAAAALPLEKEAFLVKATADGVKDAEAAWQRYYTAKSAVIGKDMAAERDQAGIRRVSDDLEAMVATAHRAADGMADAFGRIGGAIGDVTSIMAEYRQAQAQIYSNKNLDAGRKQVALSGLQIGMYGDMAQAARGFFKEKSAGYKAVMAAEKVFRAFEFAMSVQAMVQNAAETLGFVTNSAARATAAGTEGIANQSKLPFPFNIAAMAATGAALLAAGVAVLSGGRGGGASNYAAGNTGTGTVLGDKAAKSDSLNRAIEQLREVDTVTSVYARQMAASLRSIDNQIGGLASVLVRSGNLSADDQVAQGFKPNAVGSILGSVPIVGGILKGLFGTKTKVIGSGVYGGDQSLADILAGNFAASTYSDVQKKKKLFGITTSTKYSTVYGGALDDNVTDQFALIIKSFNDAILAAAGPLGATTADITAKLSSFVFGLGKIDLTGLSGAEIQEKLAAVFGAAADQMALTAFPGMTKFQKVGEGAFETLVRVASTVEAVTDTLDQFGVGLKVLSIDAKIALANQFDTISDFSSAAQDYFTTFYTRGEQATARAGQLAKVFGSMNLAMPTTLAAFRALVEAQDLASASGQANYATLLKLGPAFADLLGSLGDAKSAADAADDLREAWKSVGDDIMDEVKRIRSLTGSDSASFASLQGQFNAATEAARGGDQAMAKALPGLSQSLLSAAEKAATSRQELERIRAQTAASLEDTYASVMGRANAGDPGSITEVLDRITAEQAASTQSAANDVTAGLIAQTDALADAIDQLRQDTVVGLAAVAGNTGKVARSLDDVMNGGGAMQVNVAA